MDPFHSHSKYAANHIHTESSSCQNDCRAHARVCVSVCVCMRDVRSQSLDDDDVQSDLSVFCKNPILMMVVERARNALRQAHLLSPRKRITQHDNFSRHHLENQVFAWWIIGIYIYIVSISICARREK